MKTKLIFKTSNFSSEFWTEMPFTPRINEFINVKDILLTNEIQEIKKAASNWSGEKGVVKSVEYRHDDNEFYPEINVLCEDCA